MVLVSHDSLAIKEGLTHNLHIAIRILLVSGSKRTATREYSARLSERQQYAHHVGITDSSVIAWRVCA